MFEALDGMQIKDMKLSVKFTPNIVARFVKKMAVPAVIVIEYFIHDRCRYSAKILFHSC